MRIDFNEIRNVLADVERLLALHHGKELPDPDGRMAIAVRDDSKTAALSHDLLAMQDFLQLAGAEISTVYWMTKGREDPRRSRGHRWPMAQPSSRDTNSRCGTSPSYVGQRGQMKRAPAGASALS